MNEELEHKIIHLIATDHIEAAIELLLLHFQDHDRIEEVIIFSSRYHALLRKQSMGVMGYDEEQRTLNQLSISILEFVKREAKLSQRPQTTKQIEEHYLLSLARIVILRIFNQEAHPISQLSMSNIHKLSGINSRRYIAETIYEMEKDQLVIKVKEEDGTYWKLTDKGMAIAQTVNNALLFVKKEE